MTDTSHPALPPALAAGHVAVITGGASGIGLAAAQRFAGLGLKLALADVNEDALEAARDALSGHDVLAQACDVADRAQVEAFRDGVLERFGAVHVLMNNAGTVMNPGKTWENPDGWRKLLDINLGGIINGVQAFVPGMLEAGAPGMVINTGSKQGITLPPGNSAYNVSKAGVKAFTEMLAHELRTLEDCRLSAHLLIPGFTYTGIIAQFLPEKPPAAWLPEQVVDFMMDALARGDFYILCPDNDVDRPTDEKRIAWTAGDIIENRPPLSRWRPDFAEAFETYMKG